MIYWITVKVRYIFGYSDWQSKLDEQKSGSMFEYYRFALQADVLVDLIHKSLNDND